MSKMLDYAVWADWGGSGYFEHMEGRMLGSSSPEGALKTLTEIRPEILNAYHLIVVESGTSPNDQKNWSIWQKNYD